MTGNSYEHDTHAGPQNCDDEGTFFAVPTLNLTTNAEFTSYIKANYFSRISDKDLAALLEYYPSNVTQGSPFDTGDANALSPEYKRHAALLGDLIFQAPRRLFQQYTASKQNTWMFLFKRYKYLGGLGSFHGTDAVDMFDVTDLTDYLIHFVSRLDPNGASVPEWPQFSLDARKLLTLLDGGTPVTVGADDYRVEGMDLLNKVLLETRCNLLTASIAQFYYPISTLTFDVRAFHETTPIFLSRVLGLKSWPLETRLTASIGLRTSSRSER